MMKKPILLVVLCMALCLPMAISAAAEIPTVSENDQVDIVVISRQDFDDMTEVNRSASGTNVNANNGFVALDGLDCEIQNGELHVNHSGRLDPQKNYPFFDFQYKHVDNFPLVAEDAIFSMKIKPVENFSAGNMLYWGVDGNLEGERVTISNLELKIDGQVVGTLTQGEFSLVEWAFHYDKTNRKVASVEILLNGASVGSYTPSKTVSRIDFFRAFRYASGKSVIDDVTFALGCTSILYAKNAEESYDPNDYLPEVGQSPIPVIDEGNKVWMDIVANIDFNDMQAVSTEPSKIGETQGIGALNGMKTAIENGELVIESSSEAPSAHLDFQFEQAENFVKVKEDMIFSMKIKPLSANLNVGALLNYKCTLDFDDNHCQIAGSNLKIDGREVGALPYGVFSLVEFVFHYNENTSVFDSVDVLLNSVQVASYSIKSDSLIGHVKIFRMFSEFNGKFAVDDMILARGTTSLVYYSPNAQKPATQDPNNGGQSGNPNDNQTPDTDSVTTDATTEAPTPDSAPDTSDGTKTEKKGCFSAVTTVGIGMLVCVIGAAFMKKREDLES